MSDLNSRGRKLDSSDSTRRLISEPQYPSSGPDLPMVHDGIILSLNSGQKSYIYLSGQNVGRPEPPGKVAPVIQVSDLRDKPEGEGSIVSSSNNSSYFTNSTLKLLSNRRQVGSKEVNSFAEYDSPVDGWGSQATYFLSLVGLVTGLANLWRFPTLAYIYGSEFILAYLILYILIGPAMCFIEMASGQFSSAGPSKIWKCLPILSGVGGGQMVLGLYMLVVYFVLSSMANFYLIDGLYNHKPWNSCDLGTGGETCCDPANVSDFNFMCSHGGSKMMAAEQYYRQVVLGNWPDANNNGRLWMYTCSTLVVLTILMISSTRGIRSCGIIASIAGVVSLSLLVFFTVIGALRENSVTGFDCLRRLEWSNMANSEVWFVAATQVLLSMSLSCGNLITYCSYNGFRNNVLRDSTVLHLINILVALLSCCAFFLHLGAAAAKFDAVDVCSLFRRDQESYLGLPFMLLSDLVSHSGIPALQVWDGNVLLILFPVMFICSGLGVMCGLVHSCLHTIKTFCRIKYRCMSLVLVLVLTWSSSMVFLVKSGCKLYYLLDLYGFSITALFLSVLYLFGYNIIYGVRNWYRDLKFMLDLSTLWGMPVIWILVPFLFTALVLWQLTNYKYFAMLLEGLAWEFPVAIVLMAIPLFLVVGKAVIQVYSQVDYGLVDRIKQASKASLDWGPKDLRVRHEWLKLRHNSTLGSSWQKSALHPSSDSRSKV